jgi:hypothetical protein
MKKSIFFGSKRPQSAACLGDEVLYGLVGVPLSTRHQVEDKLHTKNKNNNYLFPQQYYDVQSDPMMDP